MGNMKLEGLRMGDWLSGDDWRCINKIWNSGNVRIEQDGSGIFNTNCRLQMEV